MDEYRQSDPVAARRLSVEIRLGLYEQPITPAVLEPLLAAWQAQREARGTLGAVRSSALVEDRAGANFAGQFESFLGVADEEEFVTAVRACWAALWTAGRAATWTTTSESRRYAMAVLIQPSLSARLRRRLEPDGRRRDAHHLYVGPRLRHRPRGGRPRSYRLSGRGYSAHDRPAARTTADCGHAGAVPQARPAPSWSTSRASTSEARLGRMLRRTEESRAGRRDRVGARRHRIQAAAGASAAIGRHRCRTNLADHPGLNGHPAGVGWGSGRAVVSSVSASSERVAPGDVLVTHVAGPALAQVCRASPASSPSSAASTSHLASLARERGIPMVLGVLDATAHPRRLEVAVDGVAGIVRWMR